METKTLILPKLGTQTESIETSQSVLILGANGAGKTRIGAWIEVDSPQKENVHRISAQRMLTMPDSTTPQSIELAEKDLLFGNPEWTFIHKRSKFGNKPAITPLSDYQKLMVYLFSDETEQNAKYKAASKAYTERLEPPVTKLDEVKKLWEHSLPHRELVIGGLRIQTKNKDQAGSLYNSSEMSDGERVIFYLIGQCLAAPNDGIIVIDEPELHLHKSIQGPIWDAVEKLRPDCLFVYLTHNVDFAAARTMAKKLWLKTFNGNDWEWDEITEDESLPQELLLEVLGSRRPVVFVEGDKGSYDVGLYEELLSEYLVIPRGGCSQVIQTVKALRANTQFHRLEAYGIIDLDRRGSEEIAKLEADSIYVLTVAEVENLFCTKEVLEIVSERMARNPNDDFQKISSKIFDGLKAELTTQVSLRASNEIKFQLNMFDASQKNADNLELALEKLFQSINVKKIYADTETLFNEVLRERDYVKLLALYNRKSLPSQISSLLGLTKGGLPETVVRLVKGDCKDKITIALTPYFGNFKQHMLDRSA